MFERRIERFLIYIFLVGIVIHNPEVLFAQAPGYSREAVAARERDVESEGIVRKDDSLKSRVGSEMLNNARDSIGNTRDDIRGENNGQSAMLRFDQHREVAPPDHPTVKLGSWYADIGIGQSIGMQYIRMDGSGVGFNTQNGRGQYLEDGFDVPLISTLYLNNYIMITRHIDFSFNINVSYAYYPFETQEDTLYVNMSDEGVFATFSSEFELSRNVRLLVYDDILYQTDYIDTRGMEDIYGGEAYEHFENTIGADLDWKFSNYDNISLSVSRKDTIAFDENFEDQEGFFYSELLSYQRELTKFSLVGLYLTGDQSYYKLDSREDVHIYETGPFAATQLTRVLYAYASLGYAFSYYPDFKEKTKSGSLVASFGIGHEISETKYQSLYYDRSQGEAFRGGVDVTDRFLYEYKWDGGRLPGSLSSGYSIYTPIDNRAGYSDLDTALDVDYQFSRNWKIYFHTSYVIRWNDAGDTNLGTPDTTSDYATWVIRFDASRPIMKKTSFNVYAEHSDRDSENEDLVYTQDSIGVYLDWRHKF